MKTVVAVQFIMLVLGGMLVAILPT